MEYLAITISTVCDSSAIRHCIRKAIPLFGMCTVAFRFRPLWIWSKMCQYSYFLEMSHILTVRSFKAEQKVCRLDVGRVCTIYERLKVRCFEVTHPPPPRSWKGFLLSSVDCSSSTFSLMEMSNQGSVLVPSSYLVDNDEQLEEKWFQLISFAS